MRLPFSRSGKPASAPDALNPHCANCGNPLAVGQDWCLDCGTAVRGRLGGPGVGSSIGVVGLTLLLVLGAVAAAYAALNSDSNKAVKTPPAAVAGVTAPSAPDVGTTAPGPASPATGAPGAVVTTPVTPSTAVPLPALPKIPGVTPKPGVRVGAAPATTPASATPPGATATPKSTATAPAKTPPTVTTPTSTPTATTPTATTPSATATAKNTILLDTDAASTYNPYALPASSFADPAKAIDGDLTTAWTYQLDPTSAGKTLVGVAIDLKAPQAIRAIKITTPSPGMTVEFYGVTGSTEPASVTDPAWLHLANRRAIKPSTSVVLKTQGKSFRYLLVWITHAPNGVSAGTIGISELSVST